MKGKSVLFLQGPLFSIRDSVMMSAKTGPSDGYPERAHEFVRVLFNMIRLLPDVTGIV